MNLIKTILLSSLATLLFTACSDDTTIIYEDTPTESSINNSKLADDENQYGYYGSYVEFGEGVVLTSRDWRIENTNNIDMYDDGDTQYLDFYDDGNADYIDLNETGQNEGNFDYGVSQDGTIIKLSNGGEIEYIKSFTKFVGYDPNGNPIEIPCYLLNYVQRFGNDKVEACGSCVYDANGELLYCDL